MNDFHLNHGRYPTEQEGLLILSEKNSGLGTSKPLIKRKLLNDTYGNLYLYELDEDGEPIIRSLGLDGQPGGQGENADFILKPPGQ